MKFVSYFAIIFGRILCEVILCDTMSLVDLQNKVSQDGLVMQTVIPKCGTTSMLTAMASTWEYIYGNQQDFPAIPYFAGNCKQVLYDKVEKCFSKNNGFNISPPWGDNIFKCAPSRCKYHTIDNHLSLSEIKQGYMVELGIDINLMSISHVYYITILRNPIYRVASEYHHWKSGWCCPWFFSDDITKHRTESMFSLSDFVQHRDCPANNRQTWMLADLPLFSAPSGRSIVPSQFSNYFSFYYKDKIRNDTAYPSSSSKSYSQYLNEDVDMLKSAMSFVTRADAIGITEDLSTSVALFFASMFSSPPLPSSAQKSVNDLETPTTSTTHSLLAENKAFLRLFKKDDDEKGHVGCYRLHYKFEDDEHDMIHKSISAPHQRHADYNISEEEKMILKKYNRNDVILYDLAVKMHNRQVSKYNLCVI
jgi:hypothetical protein